MCHDGYCYSFIFAEVQWCLVATRSFRFSHTYCKEADVYMLNVISLLCSWIVWRKKNADKQFIPLVEGIQCALDLYFWDHCRFLAFIGSIVSPLHKQNHLNNLFKKV